MNDLIPFMILVFFSILGGLLLWRIFHVVQNSIDKHKHAYSEDKFERLAKAFIQHRKDTEKRLQHIETIISEGNNRATVASNQQLNKSQQEIKIEDSSTRTRSQQPRSENLPNMLNRQRS